MNESRLHQPAAGHWPEAQLALFARGDLRMWRRARVKRHIAVCEQCASVANEFAQMREALAEAALALPPELNGAAWASLASEMTANIRLGIAAGECVADRRGSLSGRPRLTLALAGMAVLCVLAVLEHPRFMSPVSHGFVSRDSGGNTARVAAHAEIIPARMLSVPVRDGQDVIRTVNLHGDMSSRIVDDTGVTIYDVYASAE